MRQMMEMLQARQRQAEWRGVLEVLLQLFGSLRARHDSTVHSSKSVFGDSVLTKKTDLNTWNDKCFGVSLRWALDLLPEGRDAA